MRLEGARAGVEEMGGVRSKSRSRILISIRGNVAIAYCMGTLDRTTLGELSERMRSLTFEGVRGLVCSLERVSHIHFQALESLLGLHQMLREAGGEFVIAEASPYLKQILDFGGIPGKVTVLSEKLAAVEEIAEALPLLQVSNEHKSSVQQTIF